MDYDLRLMTAKAMLTGKTHLPRHPFKCPSLVNSYSA